MCSVQQQRLGLGGVSSRLRSDSLRGAADVGCRNAASQRRSVNWLFQWNGKTYVNHSTDVDYTVSVVKFCTESVWKLFGIAPQYQRLRINGQDRGYDDVLLSDWLQQYDGDFVHVAVASRLLGGKGGFGALLRGQRRARRRIRNFDACRDLTGRRVRHAKAMERLTAWLEKRKLDDELVAALGGADNDTPVSRQQQKINEALRRVGESYMHGIELTQKRTVEALERSLKSTSLSSSSSSSHSASTRSTKPQEGGPFPSKKTASLDLRYLKDIYPTVDNDDDDWEDDSLENSNAQAETS